MTHSKTGPGHPRQHDGWLPHFILCMGVVVFVFPAGTGSAMVRLGGRASPAAGQAGGAYSNTVLLTMTVLN